MSAAEPQLGTGGLRVLRAAGLLHARQYRRAIDAIRDEAYWARWGRRALLALGAGQLLAGIVFFFAYNWADLPDMAKFATIELALSAAAIGALAIGIDRAVGQALLIAASVLTGVLLAVIGQVYQTGADAFELFAAWGALMFPWVIVSRNAAHWLLWLAVAEIALALYGVQVLTVVDDVARGDVWVVVGVTLVCALAAREIAVRAGFDWLSSHWTRLVLLLAALATLFAPAAAHLLDIEDSGTESVSIAAFLLATGGAGVVYWRAKPDLAALVVVIGFADLFFICAGYRLIDEAIGFDFEQALPALTSFGAMIAWAIAGTGSAGLAMRRLSGSIGKARA
ncbi:MAG TPA: DUF2157 domain-containing protein [Dongiaceae bacterium]